MTPRDRVLAALHHREPDRVPVDLSGHRSSGIMAVAYAREFFQPREALMWKRAKELAPHIKVMLHC